MPMSKKGAGFTLARLTNLMRSIRAAGEFITPQQIEILGVIALRPGITAQDLAKETGLALSSISRNLTALGEWHRAGFPGVNLVRSVEDPHERRRKISFLTERGREVVRELLGHMEPGVAEKFDAPEAQEYLNKTYRPRKRDKQAETVD